jgi:Cytochrome c7 and related cytochrome c
MPQIFHRSFNTISKVSIFGAVFIVAGVFAILAVWVRSSYVTNVGVAVVQPVPFSHEHHVTGLGIDCRYCHTSVEDSSFAGVPPTKTCMNCHQQIWVGSQMLEPVRASYRSGRSIEWERVNNLADFVFFNHSIHVQKGVGCVTCHGRVDRMPLVWQEKTLFMEWCLDCHRNPEQYVRPRDQVFNLAWEPAEDQIALGRRLVEEYRIRKDHGVQNLTNCSTCHR